MITGDHAITALVIAERLGIGGRDPHVLTGREIEEMTDDQLREKVATTSVYARVSPTHKLRIARQFIERGEIVAMTGDGVNDAPALKAAHIGVAMGRTGTDVAKEAAPTWCSRTTTLPALPVPFTRVEWSLRTSAR